MAIERALISVSDKTGVVALARQLASLGVELVSTGGTARVLREAQLPVRDVSELTGWPEMLGGRVKTLHPRVHGGILFRRANADDRKQTAEHDIVPIDLVVVNFYPFEAAAAKADSTAEELMENIDIGGPALVRSAAKNLLSVAAVTDPADYTRVANELRARGDLSLAMRLELARKALAATARYDGWIAAELERLTATDGSVHLSPRPCTGDLPQRLHLTLARHLALRYGENPHQKAALYVPAGRPAEGLAGARQLQGKELSYNNLVDLDAAWQVVEEFSRPAAAIIKHNNPCGAAEQETLAEAYRKAYAGDPVSAFGGVLAFNRAVDAATAEEVAKLFVECIIAPGYEPPAREAFAAKKNLRLMEMPARGLPGTLEYKTISGGVLAQQADGYDFTPGELKVVTARAPTKDELQWLRFAWKVVKHVKSNAIVFARGGQTLGVGAGQMSRVDSVKVAVMKARDCGASLAGSVMASDAFFPFSDGIAEAARAGATAVIQPGGSVRDAEVVGVANELGLAMVFTGIRHFRH